MTRNLAFLPLAAMMIACTPTPASNDSAAPAGETTMPAPEAPPPANAQTPTGEATEGMPMVCDAAPVQNLVGQKSTVAIGRDALARTGAKSLRVIGPGMAVTMDFRNDRLNIEVDDKNVITAIRCG